MQENFPKLNEDEQLRAENDFLKMKLMLENGAKFGNPSGFEIDPRTENEFLNYITEFERQAANAGFIRIFDKIERPNQFLPAAELADDEIEEAYKLLSAYLYRYSIALDVCSPNVSTRELYRFVLEELFNHEMDDMNIPGMMHCFIYDEFHPDPVYENTRAATEECINFILDKRPLEWTHNFSGDQLRLNNYFPLSIEDLKALVNRFKKRYTDIRITNIESTACTVQDEESTVNGNFAMIVASEDGSHVLTGEWTVVFALDKKFDSWYITEVNIEGISF